MKISDSISDKEKEMNSSALDRLSELAPTRRVSSQTAGEIERDVENELLSDEEVSTEKSDDAQTLHLNEKRSQQANRYLQEFVYAMSHDLKMPLRAINGFSGLLIEDYAEQLDDKGKKYIKRIVDGAVQMDQLINCATEISRICSKEPEFIDVEMNELLEHVVDDLHDTIKAAKAVVTWDSLPTVYGDSVQMMQLFRHLLENSIRFRSETPPTIRITCKVFDDTQVFEVSDNGIGIDQKDLENAFAMFRRIGVQDLETVGLGAGLTICRRIVERHGGQIKLESKLGSGTKAIFEIALKKC